MPDLYLFISCETKKCRHHPGVIIGRANTFKKESNNSMGSRCNVCNSFHSEKFNMALKCIPVNFKDKLNSLERYMGCHLVSSQCVILNRIVLFNSHSILLKFSKDITVKCLLGMHVSICSLFGEFVPDILCFADICAVLYFVPTMFIGSKYI